MEEPSKETAVSICGRSSKIAPIEAQRKNLANTTAKTSVLPSTPRKHHKSTRKGRVAWWRRALKMILGLLISLFITAGYIASMYAAVALLYGKEAAWIHCGGDEGGDGPDDGPDAVVAIAWVKMGALSLYTLLLLLVSLACLHKWPAGIMPNSLEPREILGLTGTHSVWRDLMEPLLATLFLQSTSIAAILIRLMLQGRTTLARVFQSPWSNFLDRLKDPLVVHGLFVGPVVEELVFRSVIVTLLEEYFMYPPIWALLISSALFSLAHAHRLIRRIAVTLWTRKTLVALDDHLIPSLVQCAFTFVFGAYVGFFFLKRLKVNLCIAIHVICNVIGFPIDAMLELPRPFAWGLLTWFVVSLAIFVSIYMDAFASTLLQ